MKERIFITGVNGFIGGYLATKLLDKGYEVHGLTIEAEAKIKGVIPHKGNLNEHEGIAKILEEVQPHFIVHLAAQTEVEKSFYDQISFSETNYVGTVNLIECAKELPNLKLFIFASTMETYGWQDEKDWKPFNEETPQNPNAPYAVAKIGCEYYLRYAGRAYNLPWVALRQTNTYGRWDNDFFVVEQFITQMLKNPEEVNFGYKDPYRNFLYIDDLIALYIKLIEEPNKAKGQIFCTGPDNAITIGKLAEIIAKKLNWNGKINWNKKPKRVGEIYYLNSTHDKAQRNLGWEPKVSLNEGLDKTIKIWKEKLEKFKQTEEEITNKEKEYGKD